MEDESLDRWAQRREHRRRPVGARCAVPLEGGPAVRAHTRQAARWLLFSWGGYQWVPEGVTDDYPASRRYLARIEGDGVMRPEPGIKPPRSVYSAAPAATGSHEKSRSGS